MPLITKSQILKANEDTVGNRELKIKSKNSKNSNLIIHLVQPMQQLKKKKQEQKLVSLFELKKITQQIKKILNQYEWLLLIFIGLVSNVEDFVMKIKILLTYDSTNWEAAEQ